MAKCFITGVEVDIRDAYILDLGEARRAIRDLRNRINALEHLADDLGKRDEVESTRYGKTIKRTELRILVGGIASALSEVCPGRKLFIRFPDWQARRKETLSAPDPSRAITAKKQIPPACRVSLPAADDGERPDLE
jgi:hypothetical protein